ncbi:hypothetical protein Tco_1015470 [Tanacetum coccineum]|uniref:Uncharacterized protein n=1 Tax=Tanacetum coccineum TaxID=301880 RepID=A0ABQ5FM21_9ASTR
MRCSTEESICYRYTLDVQRMSRDAIVVYEMFNGGGEMLSSRDGGLTSIEEDVIEPTRVYEALEHRLVVAEAAQRLRLPLISKDGEVHEEDIEKMSVLSRTSIDSTSTSMTISSNSSNYTNVTSINVGGSTNNVFPTGASDMGDPAVQHAPLPMDVLLREIKIQLKTKCDKLADAFIDDLVVDVGVRSGILSLFAAQVIKGKIEDVELPEKADILISEPMGKLIMSCLLSYECLFDE